MTADPEEIVERRMITQAELGDLVKSLRIANNWKQTTLAEYARVRDRTIQRVENGERSSVHTRAQSRGHSNSMTWTFSTSLCSFPTSNSGKPMKPN
jgi:DNA-binding XRE family transcriptional regulator